MWIFICCIWFGSKVNANVKDKNVIRCKNHRVHNLSLFFARNLRCSVFFSDIHNFVRVLTHTVNSMGMWFEWPSSSQFNIAKLPVSEFIQFFICENISQFTSRARRQREGERARQNTIIIFTFGLFFGLVLRFIDSSLLSATVRITQYRLFNGILFARLGPTVNEIGLSIHFFLFSSFASMYFYTQCKWKTTEKKQIIYTLVEFIQLHLSMNSYSVEIFI